LKTLVTIASYRHPVPAYVAKTQLETEGIRCFVDDETSRTRDWLASGEAAGVRLQVASADADRARHLLDARA
jgi:hypothetical protein